MIDIDQQAQKSARVLVEDLGIMYLSSERIGRITAICQQHIAAVIKAERERCALRISEAMVDASVEKLASIDDAFGWLSEADRRDLMRQTLEAALCSEVSA